MRRFHDLVPHGSMADRGAWASRHPWLAGIYWTLMFGMLVVPLSLLMTPTVRAVLLATYFVVTPVVWRVRQGRQDYQEAIHGPPPQ